jgi:dTDP-glucose pyrophosphorylase
MVVLMKKNYLENTIYLDQNLKDCIPRLNKIDDKIIFILDKKKHLVGTLTDGDLRRSILKRKSLRILEIMNKKPKYIFEKELQNLESLKLKNKKYKFLAVLNEKKEFIKYIDINNYDRNNDIAVVIMAGGKGERLMPMTKTIPKPMIKINNKPIIFYLIENLVQQKFINFYVSVNYLSHKLIAPLNKLGKKNNVNIKFLLEKKELGTAGSLSLINDYFKKYLVINGDIFTNLNFVDFISFHKKNDSDISVCVKTVNHQIPYGVFKTDSFGNVKDLEEKPILKYNFACGIYLMNNKIMKLFKKNKKIDMPDLIKENLKKKSIKIKLFNVSEFWEDLGTKENLNNLKKNIKNILF